MDDEDDASDASATKQDRRAWTIIQDVGDGLLRDGSADHDHLEDEVIPALES